jgi:mannose-1-phosphate guanylyltransferase / mannose-6-phosphate isomerase
LPYPQSLPLILSDNFSKMLKNVAVILSGGAGSRLWPVSRVSEPKQLHVFTDETSLLSQTVQRADALNNIDEILIVCSSTHKVLVKQHAAPYTQKPIAYLLEPVARNTAAAITCAACYLQTRYSQYDVCMVVLPSDHHMQQGDEFGDAISYALNGARAGYLITFGIAANKPETGFGYLEMGEALDIPKIHGVKNFVEKPNAERAQQMLDAGGFSWNSGMFVMRCAQFLNEIERFEPYILHACAASVSASTQRDSFTTLAIAPLQECPSTSVDYAVFERSKAVAMVSLDAQWTDLGSWAAVADLHEQFAAADEKKSIVVSINANQNYVQAGKTVAIVGVSDLVVIDTPDALLISHRNETQRVKDVVASLNLQQPEITKNYPKVRCTWGTYEPLSQGINHQITHLVVEPGGRLSLQPHEHHAEHWVVVSGQATITVGENTTDFVTGQYVHIDKQQDHQLENRAREPLIIVKVQIGSNLGEDDIKRFDDVSVHT